MESETTGTAAHAMSNGGAKIPGVAPRTDGKVLDVKSEEYRAKNSRRCDLISKKYRGGLTAEEEAEFERLDEICYAAVITAFPRPTLIDERLAQVEALLRAEAAAAE